MNFAVLAGFLFCMFIIGIGNFKKIRSLKGFYVSNRNGSTLLVTGSLIATTIGGSATIGLAGLGFTQGLTAAWWLLSGAVCLFILALFWAGKVRDYGVYTLPEVLQKQYDSPAMRLISSIIITVAWIGIVAAQMIAAGRIMDILMPGYYHLFVMICGIIFIVYTFSGGQFSIMRTDFFQSILILAGISAVLIMSYLKYGPVTGLDLPAGALSFPVSEEFGYSNILMYFLFIGTSFMAGPDIYSRILSAKDHKTASRSVFFTAIFMAALAFSIALIGMYAKGVNPGIKAESAFLDLTMNTLPDGFKGVVFAALIAAVMSSADTCLLTSSVILSSNIIKPIFKLEISEEKELKYTRYIIVVVGIISLTTALYINGIIKSLLLAFTFYTAGLIVPIVFGFYREKLRLNSNGAIAASVTGGLSALVLKYMALNQFLIYIFPAVIVILFAVSWITGRKSHAL